MKHLVSLHGKHVPISVRWWRGLGIISLPSMALFEWRAFLRWGAVFGWGAVVGWWALLGWGTIQKSGNWRESKVAPERLTLKSRRRRRRMNQRVSHCKTPNQVRNRCHYRGRIYDHPSPWTCWEWRAVCPICSHVAQPVPPLVSTFGDT